MSFKVSDYFSGIGVKRLSQVEIDSALSNQHEFNGISGFRDFFGTDKIHFKGRFIYMNDEESETITSDATLTWYDARENHPSRTEYRLYYSGNAAIEKAVAGDLLIIARASADTLFVILAAAGSTLEQQLIWLFSLEEIGSRFTFKDFSDDRKDLGFAGRYIIAELGIEPEDDSPDFLDEIQKRFGNTFPSTKEFSTFSRSTVKNISPLEDPDGALIAWLLREELLFKTLETVLVKRKLYEGFGENNNDVDEFLSFSLSVQNRRKSRAGYSFENNLEYLFSLLNISFSRGPVTERNNKPDFIFPDISYYHSPKSDPSLLTMLGVKTTAKDRWRQIISEAAKISQKHLITLEPGISRNQTLDMTANNVQLVIPASIQPSYTEEQRKRILNLKEFVDLVLDRQRKRGDGGLLFSVT